MFLPLLHRMEERAGERRRVLPGIPLSSILSPLVPRGERKQQRRVLQEPPIVTAFPYPQSWTCSPF